MSKQARQMLVVVLLAVLAASVTKLGLSHARYARERRSNAALAEIMHAAELAAPPPAVTVTPAPRTPADGGPGAPAETPAPTPKLIQPQFIELYAENHDLAGWLTAEGIGVDHPVMYTPGDQNHYLELNYYGYWAASGELFLADPWGEETNHAIVYGHKMRDGSMLGRMIRYAEEDFGLENRILSFSTLYEKSDYELVAAFYSRIYAEDDGTAAFRYYDCADLSRQEDFEYYVREVKAAALYDTGVTPVWGDTLLTISTCEHYTEDGRFVVVARKCAPAADGSA